MNRLTIEEYLEEIKLSLVSQNSILSNFIIGSNLYIIFRAISEVLSRRDLRIEEAISALSVFTAEGEELDSLALIYGLNRNLGTKAKGYVLIDNYSGGIKKGNVIETMDSSKQYVILEDVLLDSISKRAVYVESALAGERFNILSGTKLKSLSLPTASIYVGKELNQTNVFKGVISGGSDRESDLDFRVRVLSLLQKGFLVKGSYLDLLTLLVDEYPGLEFNLLEDYPTPSVLTLFISQGIDTLYQDLMLFLKNNLPVGVRYQVVPLQYEYIDLEIDVVANISSDLDFIREEIISVCNIYFNSREVGNIFTKNELLGFLNARISVQSININYPIENIVVPSSNRKIKLNNLNIQLSK